MFEGEYSGVLQPMVHYVPLKKDFSNFDDVVELISDPAGCEQIVENAHRDLIRSGRYSYESFVAGVDEALLAAGLDPAIKPAQRAMLTGRSSVGAFAGAYKPRLAISISARGW